MFHVLVVIAGLVQCSSMQDMFSLLDANTLSELPLEKLLQVKSSFDLPELNDKQTPSSSLPEALALQNPKKPNDRGGQGYEHQQQDSKKSDKKGIQSIFQVSVTALSFLAFGGYLLCLLVQAIKAKDTATTTTTTTTTTTMAPMMIQALFRPANQNKRRKVKRPRPSRQRKPKPERKPRTKRQVWPEVDKEEMYYALVHLSEAYVHFNTIDYKSLNYSRSLYL